MSCMYRLTSVEIENWKKMSKSEKELDKYVQIGFLMDIVYRSSINMAFIVTKK